MPSGTATAMPFETVHVSNFGCRWRPKVSSRVPRAGQSRTPFHGRIPPDGPDGVFAGLLRERVEQPLEPLRLVGELRDLVPPRGRLEALAPQQRLALRLQRRDAALLLPAARVEAVDLRLQRLLAGEVVAQARLGVAVLAQQPPVAAGEAVEPLDRVEPGGEVPRLEQNAEVAVAAEAVEQPGARAKSGAGVVGGVGRRGALGRDGREAAAELLARRGDELPFSRRELQLQLEALELLRERRFLLLALGELRLEQRDAALQAIEVRLAGIVLGEDGRRDDGDQEEGENREPSNRGATGAAARNPQFRILASQFSRTTSLPRRREAGRR